MKTTDIIIQGARENNLKNISLKIPKKKIVVFTGVSGSGKSSLVFDTIAAESQRLLNETYNSFIRQRLQKYGKPDVDSMQNLSVAIIIDQKRIGGNARSTVGTITDIYSLLRLLFSRIGQPFVGYSNVFSFNNPKGMCPHCEGLGKVNTVDLDKLLDKNKSLNEGAISFPTFEVGGWRWTRYVYSGLFDNDKKLKDYSQEEWHNLVYAKMKLSNPDPGYPKSKDYEGILPRFERSFFKRESRETGGKNAQRFKAIVKQGTCPVCKGNRLSTEMLKCKINGKNIADYCSLQIDELLPYINSIHINSIDSVVQSLKERLQSLIDIGLNYLTLDRETSTLSGGESQRIKLVRHLGSSLTDLTYIFDEPSVGLHPSDVHKLNKLLIELRDKGNTVLIIEHDPDVIQIADHIVDMGIGAGKDGGHIVYQGGLRNLKLADTPTGRYLSQIPNIKTNCRIAKGYFSLTDVCTHNLKNISVKIPQAVMTVVTGVAGSGKSSLVQALLKEYPNITAIDQSALAGSKRSNIATYTGVMDKIRELFAKENQVSLSLFSTNSEGACPECKGLGIISTDLAFMDTVETLCEVCSGSGYKREVLKYKYTGKTIEDIAAMTVKEAANFFQLQNFNKTLNRLEEVGLDYITLGQSLNTLSGGERQRVKLADQLNNKNQTYVFDEPTSGLHGSDIVRLLVIFNHLVDNGNTVIIIEHNLDIISQADWIIDIGPGAGRDGGQIIFEGYPKDIIKSSDSVTGQYLKEYLSL